MEDLLNRIGILLICSKFRHFTKYSFLAFRRRSQLLKPDLVDSGQERVLGVEARIMQLEIGLNLV